MLNESKEDKSSQENKNKHLVNQTSNLSGNESVAQRKKKSLFIKVKGLDEESHADEAKRHIFNDEAPLLPLHVVSKQEGLGSDQQVDSKASQQHIPSSK